MSNDLWQRYCELFRFYPEVGLSIDISRMRFNNDFFGKMAPAVKAAFENMRALEAGEIVNPDEQRMVGHYWLRSPERAPSKEVGSAIAGVVEQIKTFTAKVHAGEIAPEKGGTFENVLLIGIGGSALGPQLVADALWSEKDTMKIYFCDNTDPDGIARTISQLGDGLRRTLSIVISKSGGTVETRNGALEAAHAYGNLGLSFAKHVVAITCPDSKLDQQAVKEGWLDRFYMWDWVGGRTSLFSAVGLLPAALQGVDIDLFLRGAAEMDSVTRTEELQQNPSMLLALMWYVAGEGRGRKDMVILPYKDRLCLFSKYLQQLVMESLGKERDLSGEIVHQGIAVYGNKGSTDQHAYVQQLRDGVNNFFATFIEVLSDYTQGQAYAPNIEVEAGLTSGDYLQGFMLGTRKALFESNRDSVTITIDTLTARSLGAMIALYERAVGYYASLVNINAYHQPGVEAGKKAAAQVVELKKKIQSYMTKEGAQPKSAEQVAQALSAPDDCETVYKILEHLAANTCYGIKRVGSERHPRNASYTLAR